MKNSFFLCFGAGIYQSYLVKTLKKMRLNVISVDKDKNAPALKYSDIKIIQSVSNTQKIKKYLEKLKLSENIVGVVTQAARESIQSVSDFNQIFGLKGLNKKTTKKLLKKNLLCKSFNKNLGNFYKYSDLKNINNFPVLSKFPNESGGKGISLLNTKKDIKILKNKIKDNEKVYIEKFLDGEHFNIVGLKDKSKIKIYCILSKKINNNFSTDKITYTPSYNPNKKKIYKFCEYVLKKTNFDFGPFQLEIILSKNKIYLAEIETSCIGSYISELIIPRVNNSCLVKDTINLILGHKINHQLKNYKKYSILKFFYKLNEFKKLKRTIKNKKFKIITKKNYLIKQKQRLAKVVIYFETKNKNTFNNFNKFI